MMAVSRRASKVLAEQVARMALTWSSVNTGTGLSGTLGGRILSMGEWGISPSSSSHRKSCCRLRYRLATVLAERPAFREVFQEGLDVLAGQLGHRRRHPAVGEEGGELLRRLGVGLDGARAICSRPAGAGARRGADRSAPPLEWVRL